MLGMERLWLTVFSTPDGMEQHLINTLLSNVSFRRFLIEIRTSAPGATLPLAEAAVSVGLRQLQTFQVLKEVTDS